MPTEERGILIKGPWKRKTKFPTNLVQEVEEDIAFIENLTKNMMIKLIYTMGENGINIKGKTFLRDIGFVTEGLKSTLCRQFGIGHPISDFIETTTDLKIEQIKGKEAVTAIFNHKKLEKIMEKMKLGDENKSDIS